MQQGSPLVSASVSRERMAKMLAMLRDGSALDVALKQHFGFDAFRPQQREIVEDVLGGRDVFALLPTGGGKSLCYQLPAILTSGLTVVVSPLVALMKDQVDAMVTAGVAATFLNSTLDTEEFLARVDLLESGAYKLLYVAPERLVASGFSERLRRWQIARVAVDEAHCISEWGHDFRPEYRQIGILRERFPEVPFVVLTATATERVRDDIIARLHLREPRIHVASFNRPNLTYRVSHRRRSAETLAAWLVARPDDPGIVYVRSRATAEDLANRLRGHGIAAQPYHAGLDGATRARNQEAFVRDDVRVICATIAFGMGIDKSNVRFVVHYDVPRSIEGYYQETGRAGRDGAPAECLMFFTYADVGPQERFVAEKEDPHEREVARAQLERVARYAYSLDCRRRELLRYFGERWDDVPCGGCDTCLEPPREVDATVDAQKLLSCIYRIREASGHGVGIAHVVDVLTGAETDKIMRLGHDRLRTYGLGRDRSKSAWRHLGDELLRLGLIRVDAARFNIVELTAAGRAALVDRTPILVREPTAAPATARKRRGGETEPAPTGAEEALFRELRTLRRTIADERDVPAYVIFSDAVLRAMARERPRTSAQLLGIPGVGEKKLADFGARFLAAIARG